MKVHTHKNNLSGYITVEETVPGMSEMALKDIYSYDELIQMCQTKYKCTPRKSILFNYESLFWKEHLYPLDISEDGRYSVYCLEGNISENSWIIWGFINIDKQLFDEFFIIKEKD